jgi:hypothetical protein
MRGAHAVAVFALPDVQENIRRKVHEDKSLHFPFYSD